jgi:hypothetical protein
MQAEFLAWKHRADNPMICVTVSSLDGDGSASNVAVGMVPRSEWEGGNNEANFNSIFEKYDFRQDEQFAVQLVVSGLQLATCTTRKFSPCLSHLHSSVLISVRPEDYAEEIIRRMGDARGPRNVNYKLDLRLTGLRGAAHLNGALCLLKGGDPSNPERCVVCLVNESGREISVRHENVENMPRIMLFAEEM